MKRENICCQILTELLVVRYVQINVMLPVIKRLLSLYILSLLFKGTSPSWWPFGLTSRSAFSRFLALWVRILAGAWVFVFRECGVLCR